MFDSHVDVELRLLERRMLRYYRRKVRRRILRRLLMLVFSATVLAGLWHLFSR